jgi:hypothetical protein
MKLFLPQIVKIYVFFLNDKSVTFTYIKTIIQDREKFWRWAIFLITVLNYRRLRGEFSELQKYSLQRIALNG